jgi:hypothetical protein
LEKSPAFQFYPKDFLSDGKVILMSSEVRGIYITLLCVDWIDNGLPEKRTAWLSMGGYSFFKPDGTLRAREDAEAVMAELSVCFTAHPERPGFVTNQRLQKERVIQRAHRLERSRSGKRGAANRWVKPENHASDSSAIKEPMANDGSSTASASSTAKDKSKDKDVCPPATPATDLTGQPVEAERRRPPFQKPKLEEVRAYCKERGNTVDPLKWLAFYESNGWRVGRNPMKNWKAAIVTWEGRDNFRNGNGHVQPPAPPQRKGTSQTWKDVEAEMNALNPVKL